MKAFTFKYYYQLSIVPLLIRRNSLLVLDLGLDILDGVRGLDLKGDGFTREGFYEDLHLRTSENNEGKLCC